MKLSPGQDAPLFFASTWDDQPIELKVLRGKPVWLAFFRYAACPLCNLRVHQMIQRFDAYQSRGLQVLAVFQSPAEKMAEYVGKQAPPFPLIADPEEGLYARYGLGNSLLGFAAPRNLKKAMEAARAGFVPGVPDGTVTRLPADFLIDAGGVIRDVYYAPEIGEHIPFERVEAFIDSQARAAAAQATP
ncbi:MAG: AhpC/TSA family protein [Polyangiaceae bacterium]|nr:AhpC/TSA family protein [Myxococcales bacterium]MCB9587435.1 AhpC/TSA family protein [Polyangiaceae bacterium]MCB9605768.1 AhpC/TSA family protein [Polyangiaceae bacterium]